MNEELSKSTGKEFSRLNENLEKEICRFRENVDVLFKNVERLGGFEPRETDKKDTSQQNRSTALDIYGDLISKLRTVTGDLEWCLKNLDRMV